MHAQLQRWKTPRTPSVQMNDRSDFVLSGVDDDASIRDLLAKAAQLEMEKNYQAAMNAFRDAAIAYQKRTQKCLRLLGIHKYLVNQSVVSSSVYKVWIGANPNGFRTLPYSSPHVTAELIRVILVEQLQYEKSFAEIFAFLHHSLSTAGMRFFSPGGSFIRRLCWLLEVLFGKRDDEGMIFLRDTSVRIGIDLLADEVEKRCKTEGQGFTLPI